jgi:hypothetical protein
MKRLLKTAPPPDTVTVSFADYKKCVNAAPKAKAAAEAEANAKIKSMLSPSDLIDILNQIDELKQNVSSKIDEGRLLIIIGEVVYQLSEYRDNQYPHRKLTKLDS